MKNQNSKKILPKTLMAISLIILAIGERLFFDLGPNVELVTTVTILASIYLGKEFALIIPLLVLGFTDIFLGNTNIMLFTWSAFAIEGLFVYRIIKRIKFSQKKILSKLFYSSGFGVGASLWFYLWTNFGVWFLNNWGMYLKTLLGLISCYLAGLPFLKINLLGNLIFLPAGILIVELFNLLKNLNFKISTLLAKNCEV